MKKNTDPETLIAELVRANAEALVLIVAQVSELIAVTSAALRRQVAVPAATDATRKLELPPELLAELGSGPATPSGRPPGVPGPRD